MIAIDVIDDDIVMYYLGRYTSYPYVGNERVGLPNKVSYQ